MIIKTIANKAIRMKLSIIFITLISLVLFILIMFDIKLKEEFYFSIFIFVFLAIICYLMSTAVEWQRFTFEKKQLKVMRLYYGQDGYKTYTIKYNSYQKVILSEDKILILKTNDGKKILEMPIAADFSEEQLASILSELKKHTIFMIDEYVNTNVNHKDEKQKIQRKRKLEV